MQVEDEFARAPKEDDPLMRHMRYQLHRLMGPFEPSLPTRSIFHMKVPLLLAARFAHMGKCADERVDREMARTDDEAGELAPLRAYPVALQAYAFGREQVRDARKHERMGARALAADAPPGGLAEGAMLMMYIAQARQLLEEGSLTCADLGQDWRAYLDHPARVRNFFRITQPGLETALESTWSALGEHERRERLRENLAGWQAVAYRADVSTENLPPALRALASERFAALQQELNELRERVERRRREIYGVDEPYEMVTEERFAQMLHRVSEGLENGAYQNDEQALERDLETLGALRQRQYLTLDQVERYFGTMHPEPKRMLDSFLETRREAIRARAGARATHGSSIAGPAS
jgi:hypothetical protein